MKLKDALESLGQKESNSRAKKIAESLGIHWNSGIRFIFSVILRDTDTAPKIGSESDSESIVLEKWISKYLKGLQGRPSQRISRSPGTIPDPMIEMMLRARLPLIPKEQMTIMTFGHRLQMSAENILGLCLEEYLYYRLHEYGWHCAWGSTVRSVDFVHKDGSLLQIKNRSNSENSSSSAIRDGTKISQWYRIQATRISYKWDDLRTLTNSKNLSEEDFIVFVNNLIVKNPHCLAIEEDSPWLDYAEATPASNNLG